MYNEALNDMNEFDALLYLEKRGLMTRTPSGKPIKDDLYEAEHKLTLLLNKYKEELQLDSPVPRIKTWANKGIY